MRLYHHRLVPGALYDSTSTSNGFLAVSQEAKSNFCLFYRTTPRWVSPEGDTETEFGANVFTRDEDL